MRIEFEISIKDEFGNDLAQGIIISQEQLAKIIEIVPELEDYAEDYVDEHKVLINANP